MRFSILLSPVKCQNIPLQGKTSRECGSDRTSCATGSPLIRTDVAAFVTPTSLEARHTYRPASFADTRIKCRGYSAVCLKMRNRERESHETTPCRVKGGLLWRFTDRTCSRAGISDKSGENATINNSYKIRETDYRRNERVDNEVENTKFLNDSNGNRTQDSEIPSPTFKRCDKGESLYFSKSKGGVAKR